MPYLYSFLFAAFLGLSAPAHAVIFDFQTESVIPDVGQLEILIETVSDPRDSVFVQTQHNTLFDPDSPIFASPNFVRLATSYSVGMYFADIVVTPEELTVAVHDFHTLEFSSSFAGASLFHTTSSITLIGGPDGDFFDQWSFFITTDNSELQIPEITGRFVIAEPVPVPEASAFLVVLAGLGFFAASRRKS